MISRKKIKDTKDLEKIVIRELTIDDDNYNVRDIETIYYYKGEKISERRYKKLYDQQKREPREQA